MAPEQGVWLGGQWPLFTAPSEHPGDGVCPGLPPPRECLPRQMPTLALVLKRQILETTTVNMANKPRMQGSKSTQKTQKPEMKGSSIHCSILPRKCQRLLRGSA